MGFKSDLLKDICSFLERVLSKKHEEEDNS